MTRETKIGMAVAVSFLCLVGVVVMTKLRSGDDDNKRVAQGGNAKDPATDKGVGNPPVKPSSKQNPVKPAQFEFQQIEANQPARLPGGNGEELSTSNPPVAANPPVVAPPVNANPPPVPPPAPAAANPDLPPLPTAVAGIPPTNAQIESEDAKRNKLLEQIAKDKQQRDASSALPPVPGNPFDKIDDAKNKAGNVADNMLNKGNDF